jgi:hypothetical protein
MTDTVTRNVEDVTLIDNMSTHLQQAFTLAELLANYSPGHDGNTSFGSAVANAGNMLESILCDARNSLQEWQKQKGWPLEAGRVQS